MECYRAQIIDETFNGIKLQEIDNGLDDADLSAAIIELITERKLDVISSATELNPHIKRHPPRKIEIQIQKLDVTEKYHTCLYPTAETSAQEYDLDPLTLKPFTQEIARGHPELEPVYIEIAVLDRYRLDPRYDFHCSEYAGRLSMLSHDSKSGPVAERDQAFLQTFGLGIDEEQNVYVCVFLRYLSQLTPEHQRHWQSYVSHQQARMHINYYTPSYLGEFYENNSAISAIRLSVDSINIICDVVWGGKLFRKSVPETVHYNLSPLMRSSKADYLSFVHELDKLISENIDLQFFQGKLDLFTVTKHPDGTVERKQKGTLNLLEEWLFSGEINWQGGNDEARKEIIQRLRKIRRERQPAAHATIQNEFDVNYTMMKRKILGDAAFSLGSIFSVLLNHPRAPQIRIPKWFEECRIESI